MHFNTYMRILITGSTGFVGQNLTKYLLEQKVYEIGVLTRNPQRVLEFFPNSNLKIISTGKEMLCDIVCFNPNIVLHLAAHFTGKSDDYAITNLIDSNILLPTRILEALRHTNCKMFVNIGTFTEFVYGGGEFLSNNLYSATKSALRPIIAYYHHQCHWKWINVIIYSPYGRRNPTNKKVIDYLIDAIDSKDPISFSKGEQKLDFIHVDDIVRFFACLLERATNIEDNFVEFHLGSGENHSIREVAEIIETLINKKLNVKWGELPYREGEAMVTVAPIAKSIALLDWRPIISIEKGINILLDDIMEHK